jgi:hypothetical protein
MRSFDGWISPPASLDLAATLRDTQAAARPTTRRLLRAFVPIFPALPIGSCSFRFGPAMKYGLEVRMFLSEVTAIRFFHEA